MKIKKKPAQISIALLMALVVSVIGMTHEVLAHDRPAVLPESIPLPNGFHPEGIVFGRGPTFYVGSMADGAILEGDALTGETSQLVPGQEGRFALGLKFSRRRNEILVAGGPTGQAYVYDADTGGTVSVLQLTDDATTFINDLAFARDAVWFTDSFRPVLYRVELDRRGRLTDEITELPLSGDFVFENGNFNTNVSWQAQTAKQLSSPTAVWENSTAWIRPTVTPRALIWVGPASPPVTG